MMYMQVTYLSATVYFQHLFSAYIPPSCIINGYLAFIREVNAQLSLSHVLFSSVEVVVENWVPPPLSMRPGQWLLALLQKDLSAQGSNILNGAQASQCWLWAAIVVYNCMTAVGFTCPHAEIVLVPGPHYAHKLM